MWLLLLLAVLNFAWAAPGRCGNQTNVDMSVNKGAPTMIIGSSEQYQYIVNIASAGPANASGVVMTDVVPCDVIVQDVAAEYSPGIITCTATAVDTCPSGVGTRQKNNVQCTIPFHLAGTIATVYINVTVPSDAVAPPSGNLTNWAEVASVTCDNDLSNNRAPGTAPFRAQADNTVTIIGDQTATSGDTSPAKKLITVRNLGLSDSQDTYVTYEIPFGLKFAGVTTADATATNLLCGTVPAGQRCCTLVTSTFLNCTIGTLRPNDPWSFVVATLVPADYCIELGGCTRTFTAIVNASTFDPYYPNNKAQSTLTININSNVGVTKSGPSEVLAGSTSQTNPQFYTIVVENAGPSDAQGVQLLDFIPSILTRYPELQYPNCFTKRGERAVISPCNITCGYRFPIGSGFENLLECNITQLLVHARALIIVPFGVDQSLTPQNVTNIANVTSKTTDQDYSRNSDPHVFVIKAKSDPFINKDGPQGNIVSGVTTVFSYVFTVGNNYSPDHPSTAHSVILFNETFSSLVNPFFVSDSRCNLVGRVMTCSFGDLPSGSSITFFVNFTVSSNFIGSTARVENCASVSSNTALSEDADLTNNVDCTAFNLQQAPDVSVTKTGPDAVNAGSASARYFYTIDVTNLGPVASATNVRMQDTIPNFPTFAVPQNVAVTPFVLVGASRTLPNCNITLNLVICDIGTMAAGDVIRILVPFDVAANPAPGRFDNTAVISHTTPDTNTTNNNSTWPTIIVRVADVKITKQGPVEEVCAGDGYHWFTLTVLNLGPTDAQSVNVQDLFDGRFNLYAGGTFVYDLPGNTNPNRVCSSSGQFVFCDLQGIAFNASVTVRIRFSVNSNQPAVNGTSAIPNNATVSSLYDPNPDNNWSYITQPICNRAPLSLNKTASSSVVTAGDGVTYSYTMTGRNNGPSDAVSVVLSDFISTKWTVTGQSSQCTFNNVVGSPQYRELRCSFGNVPPQGTVSATVFFTVDQAVPPTDREPNCALLWSQTPPTLQTSPVQACADIRINNYADLFINKFADDCATAGDNSFQNTSYFVVRVDNFNGPSRAENVFVTDRIPDLLTPALDVPVTVTGAEPGWSCGYDAATSRTLTCSLGGMQRFAQITIRIPFRVPATSVPPQSVSNTATVTSARDLVPGNNNATAIQSICNNILPTIVKQGPLQVAAGNPNAYSYNLTVGNAGLSDALFVTVTDDLPGDFVWNGALSASANCNITTLATPIPDGLFSPRTQRLTCFYNRIPAGAQVPIIVFGFTVASSVRAGSRQNCATVSTPASPQGATSATSCVSTLVDVEVDLRISKVGPREICAGSSGQFFLTVSNGGPAVAPNVIVTDNLPAPLTGSSPTFVSSPAGLPGSCSFSSDGRLLTCTFGDVAPGTIFYITYTASVARNVLQPVPAKVTNRAVVTSGLTDRNSTDNNASWDTGICAYTSFTVSKDGPANVTAGTSADPIPYVYTLTITNTGPADAYSVSITDRLPQDILPLAGGPISDRGSADFCSFGNGADFNLLTCTWFSRPFPNGASTQIRFPFRVAAVANIGQRINCFDLTTSTPLTNPPVNPNPPVQACDSTWIGTRADLIVTKTGPGQLCAGDPYNWFTLDIFNNGPSYALGVSLFDFFPPSLTPVPPTVAQPTINGVATSNCSFTSLTTFACGTLRDMAPGDRLVVRFPFQVNSNVQDASATNNVIVTTTTKDDNGAQSFWTVNITGCAVYSIAKTAPTDAVVAGDSTIQYFGLTGSNTGVSDAFNVFVTDKSILTNNIDIIEQLLPVGCTVTVLSLSESSVTCGPFNLPAGTSRTFNIPWTAKASANPGSYLNCANITGATAGTYNPREVCVPFTIKATAHLVTTKRGVSPIYAGENLVGQQFDVTITNIGGSDARDVTLRDQVPAVFKVTQVFPLDKCVNPPVGNLVNCSFGTLAPQQSVSVRYTYTTAPDAVLGDYVNIACAFTTTTQNPEFIRDNCAPFTTTIKCKAPLSIDKNFTLSNGASFIVAGSDTIGTFTITVTNNGPSVSDGTSFNDNWPDALTPVGDPSFGGCSTGASFSCPLGKLWPGTSFTVTRQFRVLSGVLADSATNVVTATNGCSSTVSDSVVVPIQRRSDLCVAKTDNVDEVEAGKEYVYTITVYNDGPSDAPLVRLDDTWPFPLEIEEIIAPGWDCGNNAFFISCTRQTSLPKGSSDQIRVRFLVPTTLAPGYVTNCVRVSSANVDDYLWNNEACDTDRVINFADLEIIKTIDTDVCLVAGDQTVHTYTLTVTNKGPTIARNVVVLERFPTDLIFVPPLPSGCSPVTLNGTDYYRCLLGNMVPGQVNRLTFRFKVDPCHPAGIVENWANVTSDTTDPNLCNNVAELCTAICVESDLSITKTDGVPEVTAGDGIVYVYTICVSNNGPSCAASVNIDDQWPYAQWGAGTIGTPNTLGCSWTADQRLTCSVPGGLKVPSLGQGPVCGTVSFTVPACLEACEVCNTASVSSPDSPDPRGDNNVATDCDTVRTEADVSICKSDGVTSVVAGDGVLYTYTIDVCNNGPSCARQVRVLDHFPCDVTRQGVAIPWQGSCINTDDCNDFACNLGTLLPGQCINITSSYKVPSSAATCSITNVAVVSTVTFDKELCNNDAKDVNALLEQARLSVTKTGPATIYQTDRTPYRYVISVTNNGVSTARDVVVTDRWPAWLTQFLDRTTGIAVTASSASTKCVTTGGDFSCAVGDMALQATEFIYVSFTLRPGVPCNTTIVNRVSAFSPTDTECRDAEFSTTVQCLSPTQICINCVQRALTPVSPCYAQTQACRSSAACNACLTSISANPINPPGVCFSDDLACPMMQCIYNGQCGLGSGRECDSPDDGPIVCNNDKKRNEPVAAQELTRVILPTPKPEATEAPSGRTLNPESVSVDAKLRDNALEITFKNTLKMKVQISDVALDVQTSAGVEKVSLGKHSAVVRDSTCQRSIKLRKDWSWSCVVHLEESFLAQLAQASAVSVVAHGKAVVRDGYHPIIGVQPLHLKKQ